MLTGNQDEWKYTGDRERSLRHLNLSKEIYTQEKKSMDVDVYIYLTYMREIIWDLKKIKNKRIL